MLKKTSIRDKKIAQIKNTLIENKHETDFDVLAEKLYMASQIEYRYVLDDLDVSALQKIWLEVVRSNNNEINVENVEGLTVNERRRTTQLRFHGLVAKVKKNGVHQDNTWCLTWKGSAFLAHKIAVSKWVETRDNTVIGHSSEMVTIKNFKVLDDFRATYEVINRVEIKQPQLSLVI